MTDNERQHFTDTLTALSESEMQLFRLMAGRPDGAVLTDETDIMIARLLSMEGLMSIDENNKVQIPEDVLDTFDEVWSDEVMLLWRKRNWMYKCLDAGQYLYGVMTWDALKELFALRYPGLGMDEIREIMHSTPPFYRQFNEVEGKLVLNGYEKDDYYKYLERDIQGDTPFYVPTKEEVEELYDHGSLISSEAHTAMKEFITENFACGAYDAEIRMHELYEQINNRVRIADIADSFASSGEGDVDYSFKSDEIQVRFIEHLMEMSRECRVRDNRGHNWYEMAAIMAKKGTGKGGSIRPAGTSGSSGNSSRIIRRVKIGRNEPCPCGSGKKYKNCCGRN